MSTRLGLKKAKKVNKNPLGAPIIPKLGHHHIVGGLQKLKDKSNEQHRNTGPKPQPSIFRDKHKKIIISNKVLVAESSETDEYEYESESTSESVDSENENMAQFCKKMCKKTKVAKEMEVHKKKKIEAQIKKFVKTRKVFLNEKIKDFRSRVESNEKIGKFTLFDYNDTDVYEGYSISKLINDEIYGKTGLGIILDKITPFRIFHYTNKPKHFLVEITWAAPPTKNSNLKPNLLVKKKVKKAGK